MPGPFVHRASMQVVRDILKPIMTINIPRFNMLYYLEPDRGDYSPSHGADVKKEKYWIMDMIDRYYFNIKAHFGVYGEDFNNKDFQNYVLYLNHYLCDSMTVNQISGNDFWGRKDDLIDLASEMVTDKRKYQTRPFLEYYKNYDDLHKLMKQRITDTYVVYHKDALKWMNSWYKYIPFYLSGHVTHMIRRAVTYAAHTTALFIYKAYIETIGEGEK